MPIVLGSGSTMIQYFHGTCTSMVRWFTKRQSLTVCAPPLIVCLQCTRTVCSGIASVITNAIVSSMPELLRTTNASMWYIAIVCLVLMRSLLTTPAGYHMCHISIVLWGGLIVVYCTACTMFLQEQQDFPLTILVPVYALLMPCVTLMYIWSFYIHALTFLRMCIFDRQRAAVYRLQLSIGLVDVKTFVMTSFVPVSICLAFCHY